MSLDRSGIPRPGRRPGLRCPLGLLGFLVAAACFAAPAAVHHVHLQVRDTGVGLPAQFEVDQVTTLSLRLVADLTRQLRGSLTISAGAQFDINFQPRSPNNESARPFASS